MAAEINSDKLLRALSLLTALRQNTSGESINEYKGLTTSHVTEFHTILSNISSTGIEVPEFFIPEQEIKPLVTSTSSSGGITYSEVKYVRKSLFLTKVDGIINYLQLLLKEPPRKAGYKT